MLNTYIIENNLRNEKDKRQILPDENLKRFFKCTDNVNSWRSNLCVPPQTSSEVLDHSVLDGL